jgi:hypothetical protein
VGKNPKDALDKPKRRSLRRGVRLVMGAPAACFGGKQIRENAGYIGDLVQMIRTGPATDRQVRLSKGRNLDVLSMAWDAQVPPSEIERQLDSRRMQSARSTLCYLAGAMLFMVVGFYHAAAALPASPSLSYVVVMGAICSCFFLLAFYHALVNWQIRTRRLGTAREFMHADESWWPS